MSDLIRRTSENIAIETVLTAGVWRIEVDAHQLESAMLNLAVNARDAMPNGGRLTIETANAYIDEQYAAQYAEISVVKGGSIQAWNSSRSRSRVRNSRRASARCSTACPTCQVGIVSL
jgi:hypothetical protein